MTKSRAQAAALVFAVAIWMGAGLAGVQSAQAVPVPTGAEPPAAAAASTARPEPAAIVGQYCVGCHNQRVASGGLSFDALDPARPEAKPEVWERVIQKVRGGMMPPAGSPRPPQATIDAFAGRLETAIDRAWAADPNPGSALPAHRLNRVEYNHAINDLLGIDVDVVQLLPGDPTTDGGFDNMAEALPFSTAHMERYMSVARQVTRLAVGLPPDTPGVTTYKVPLHVVQDWRQNEDLPFGSRGGISVRHDFPVAGDYRFRVRLRTNWQDYIMGLGWKQQLEVRVDGRLVRRFALGGEAPGLPSPMSFSGPGAPGDIPWEDYMFNADEGLEVTAPVSAGPHLVGVSYVREQLEPEDVPQPEQRGRLLANDEVYMDHQAVELLEIGGPYGSIEVARDTPSRRTIFSCHPRDGAVEQACAREILSTLGRRAFRRPLQEADVTRLLGFYGRGREKGGSFDTGIQFALEYLLSDPEFLVRVYRAPAGAAASPSFRFTDTQLATRLSFFLWGTIPDDTLLRLAERGELSRPGVLEQQARRLLADPRGVDTLTHTFAAQWLNLRRIDEVVVDPEVYPHYDQSLLEGFREETELFVSHAIGEDRPITELLDANYTYVNERLARHYGIPDVYGSRFRRVTLSDPKQRGGILGHGSVLAVTSYPGRTSPVLRGKYLLENLLGAPPPPPPPNVPVLPEAGSGVILASMRERLAEHRRSPTCASCHATIDPLGFALENFDAIGGWRASDEGGHAVDASGSWPSGEPIDGLAGLRAFLLRRPDRFAHALTEKLTTYALGRRVEYYDQPAIRRIVRDAAADGYRWSSLVVGIVKSPAFSTSRVRATGSN